MTTRFWFTTQATQVLKENDLSTNSFFTLNIYERKQNHDSNTEKKEFHDNHQNYLCCLERESLGHHIILLVFLASKAPMLTLLH